MTSYVAPIGDMRFLLNAVLHLDREMADLPPFAEVGGDLAAVVLEQAGRFCGGL